MENVGEKDLKSMHYLEKIYAIICSLFICFILDLLGINKKEMNHPDRHIILKFPRVIFIDWERAKEGKTKNITQFLEYLKKFGVKIDKRLQIKYKRNKLFFILMLFSFTTSLPTFIKNLIISYKWLKRKKKGGE